MPPTNDYFQVPDRQRKLADQDRKWKRRLGWRFAAFLVIAFTVMAWIVIEYSPSQPTSWSN